MIKKLLPKGEFSRNVLTLMTGTTIAQAIPIAVSPIITRLYSPADFGVFALFLSIVSIVSVLATGKYELAIMLPRKDSDALNLIVGSSIITVFVSFLALIIILVFKENIERYLGKPNIGNWLYFFPAAILFTGLIQNFTYWHNRGKNYKQLATSQILRSASNATSQVGAGYIGLGAIGLIIGTIFGLFVAILVLIKGVLNRETNLLREISLLKQYALLKRYRRFPKYFIPGGLVNTIAIQAPVLFLSMLFGTYVAGLYDLARRVIGMPTQTISSSLSDVFRQHAVEIFRNKGNLLAAYTKMSFRTFIVASIIAVIAYLIMPSAVVIVFGQEWSEVATIIQILIPVFVFRTSVVTYTGVCLQLLEELRLDFMWQIMLLISSISGFLLGGYYESWILGLSAYSALLTICYITLWGAVYYLLKNRESELHHSTNSKSYSSKIN